jgi:hypothetical protein
MGHPCALIAGRREKPLQARILQHSREKFFAVVHTFKFFVRSKLSSANGWARLRCVLSTPRRDARDRRMISAYLRRWSTAQHTD